MPPIPTQNIWNPDVIATVVYRIIMIIVSLAYIRRKYQQPLRTDDRYQAVELLAVRISTVQDSEGTRESPFAMPIHSDRVVESPSAKSTDSNHIIQTMQAFGAAAAATLGTDGDDT